ncbi:MAG: ABC transporter substrate-binding protein [Gaiellaceae bacterium]
MVSRKKVAISLGIVAVAAISLMAASWAGAMAKAASYPRSQTLFTGGTQWGSIAGTNPYGGNYATGMVGLSNETLLRYDPLKDKYINWLAKSAKFTGPKTYTVVLRSGVKWSNGLPFTAKDVVWNFNLGRFKTAFWNNLWLNLKSMKAKGAHTVVFTFEGTPNYIQWQNLMWNLPMMSPTQSKGITTTDPASLLSWSPSVPIGTGPYTLDKAGYDPTTRVVWKKKAVWWAAQQKLEPSPQPTYIIDLCNTSNTTALAALTSHIVDLSNTGQMGIAPAVASGDVQTYLPKSPFFLSANTAWLTPNTTRKPMDDPVFRRALATALNIDAIVDKDYNGLVIKANGSGLLPVWAKWIASDLVSSKGFSYSVSDAKKLLTDAGYKMGGDGYFNNKDGSNLNLKIEVPSGWSDWEIARDMIIQDAKAAGIKISVVEGDQNKVQFTDLYNGDYDLEINNAYALSDSPWTFFNGIFNLPILSQQTFANFERYTNTRAWNLVKALDHTPVSNVAKQKSLMKSLEDILLTNLPLIPMWYNPLWAEMQSKYWTNWPQAGTSRQYTPASWRGYGQMTAIDMYAHVKKA